jgi:hypothetical protein
MAITDALVSSAACPFGLERERLIDVWEAAELQAQFKGGEAFAADLIGFLRKFHPQSVRSRTAVVRSGVNSSTPAQRFQQVLKGTTHRTHFCPDPGLFLGRNARPAERVSSAAPIKEERPRGRGAPSRQPGKPAAGLPICTCGKQKELLL